jgi:putative transcriptional regulator
MAAEFSSLKGQLLIASASLVDPNFHRTVVLVTEHTPDGAMGVVLNRPSQVALAEAVPHLSALAEDEALVYVGGPVQPEAVVALAELDTPELAAAVALGSIGYLRADADPDELIDVVRRARVFAGYSGWGAGQLEAELGEEAWIVEPAEPDDVFTSHPDDLWSSVLRRKGGAYAILARLPLDPSVN